MSPRGHFRSPWSLIAPLTLAVWLYNAETVLGTAAPPSATAIAQKVKQQAKRLEKKEGKHNLVRDSVHTKTTHKGAVVIEQKGEASFYGKGFHGKATASGKTFDQGKLTAAHPSLPLGTAATVTNLETGQHTEVRITDRGPYAKGRDIDLSKRAAQEIGLTKKDGEAPVKIEAVVPPQTAQAAAPNKATKTERKQ
jgi:rare lipoprotein A (peptidoglycan hydrolase)